MNNYFLALPILISFIITVIFMPAWIARARKAGLVGRDVNKYAFIEVAEAGGVIVVTGFLLGLLLYVAMKTFYFKDTTYVISIFALLSMILITSFIGMIDDILGWKMGLGKRLRLFLVIFAAIPLMVINAGVSSIDLPFFGLRNLGWLYPLLMIPMGIVGASTTFNFLAGYNGLEARQGILMLGALAIATWFTGNTWLSLLLLCMIASLCAFLLFNMYPARVFPGDVLTYSVGALIAATAILGNLEKFALFIFIPYILEVLLKLRGRLQKESFAKPLQDGSIDLRYPNVYGLEHAAIKVLKKWKKRVYEQDVVLLINLFQLSIIILGFILFREGIFITSHG